MKIRDPEANLEDFDRESFSKEGTPLFRELINEMWDLEVDRYTPGRYPTRIMDCILYKSLDKGDRRVFVEVNLLIDNRSEYYELYMNGNDGYNLLLTNKDAVEFLEKYEALVQKHLEEVQKMRE